MDWILIGALVAVIIALVHEFQADGKDLLGWSVVVLCACIVMSKWPLA